MQLTYEKKKKNHNGTKNHLYFKQNMTSEDRFP